MKLSVFLAASGLVAGVYVKYRLDHGKPIIPSFGTGPVEPHSKNDVIVYNPDDSKKPTIPSGSNFPIYKDGLLVDGTPQFPMIPEDEIESNPGLIEKPPIDPGLIYVYTLY